MLLLGILVTSAGLRMTPRPNIELWPPEALALSTSSLTTRPCGPLPPTMRMSMPSLAAMRLASGEANTRDWGLGMGDWGVEAGEDIGADEGISFFSSFF